MSVLKLSTPGVYVQEIPALPPSVAEVETAIPAFIGYTQKADKYKAGDLVMIPQKIEGLADYETYFGKAQDETNDGTKITVDDDGNNNYTVTVEHVANKRSLYNMYYSIKSFFDNGGGTCFICSVGIYEAIGTTPDTATLLKGLDAIANVDEVTILCIPEASLIDDPTKVVAGSNDPTKQATNYNSIVQAMIAQAAETGDRVALIDPFMVTAKTSTNPVGAIDDDVMIMRDAANGGIDSNKYAAAYYPNIVSSYYYSCDFDNLKIDTYNGGPSVAGQAKDTKMSTYLGSVLYNKVKAAIQADLVTLPPSPAMAGIYSRVDGTKGVWKAPANEGVYSVAAPSIPISGKEQESLNVDPGTGKSINVIRTFPGYGTLVWGARTLAGNDGEWKYISVRRFFNMVEESIKKSSQWAVFEPNTIGTWVKMQAMIENYLFLKWKEGALAGVKPEQAYYVNIGLGKTMTASDILNGVMNVEIGMAVSRPAEFIVLSFTQLMQQS